ncbi:MAG: cell wall-active antibiotics response protein [Dysgonamonadaceae bacterium]|jgi:predicted membrane protein|nr:cell wall-active antibiotics response protein [Dysgonamonadaceae bacterium]
MKKVVIGIIIVMLGVFLLFNNLGFLPSFIYRLVISWQTLLIAIGAVFFFDRRTGHKHENIGILLIFIGAIFLLPKIFDVNLSGILIPLLIVTAGIYFLIIAVTKKDKGDSFCEHEHFKRFDKMPFEEIPVGEDGIIKRNYVFTGSKEQWNYEKVKNIEIEAVFSSVELDFTQVELSEEAETIHIKVSSVFSEITLYVPEEWSIIIQKTGVFGSFTDSRPRDAIRLTKEKKNTVTLELEAVFGGGEIKCYE